MTCGEFTNRISDYIDRTIGDREQELMAAHADSCDSCGEMLSGTQTVKERLARLPRHRPSAGFDFALRSRLMMEVARSEKSWITNAVSSSRVRSYAAAAAVILALGITGVSQYPNFYETQSPAATRPAPSLRNQAALQQVSSVYVPPSVTPSSAQSFRGALRRLSQENSYPISQQYLQSNLDTTTMQLTAAKSRRALKTRPYNGRVRQARVRF